MKQPTLEEVLYELVASTTRQRVKLSGGLWLHYVPAHLNNGTPRLGLSRKKAWVSRTEDETVWQNLEQALARHGRAIVPGSRINEAYRRIHGRRFNILEWQEEPIQVVEQMSLLEVSAADKTYSE